MNSRETFTDLAIRAALMVAVYVAFAAALPSYHTVRGAAALLDGGVLIGLTALGIGITMIAGEFDLSVGSLAAVIGVLTVNLIITGMSVIPAIAIAVAVACAFGALQGFVIAVTGINSLVFTIGTLIGLRGFAMIISNENSVTIPIPRLGETDFFTQRVLGLLSPLSILMFAVFFVAHLFLRYTGAVSSVRLGSATPLGFDTLLLSAVTACLIGGIALEGGKGTVLGVLIGLFTMRFLVGGVASLGAPYWLQSLAIGALLIFVLIVQLSAALIRDRAVGPGLLELSPP
jgi:ribose transport system permease protein